MTNMGLRVARWIFSGIKCVAQAFGLLKNVTMEPTLERVISAIVSHVQRNDGYITKTKLLKLLYLFDLEYFRLHRETFTKFNWVYLHLGPWAGEYDQVLEGLLANNLLIERSAADPDYEAKFYKTPEDVHVLRLFPHFADEASLRVVLNTWGNKATSEILDYVYFQTEPMEHGERYQPLDFNLVSQERPAKYNRAPSTKTPQQIEALRRKFQQQLAEQPGDDIVPTTKPRYDEAYFDFIAKLETVD